MQFSDTSVEKDGLIQMCESIVFADDYGRISGNSNLLSTFTRNINRGLDRYVGLVLDSDTRWQFDDSNYTTHPIGTTDLVQGQQDYEFDREHLKIIGIEVKRENEDEWDTLKPIDYEDMKRRGISITDYWEEQGVPYRYDLVGESVWLYPPSSYNRTGGLKVFYQRHADYFATTDTSKKPGINQLYHEYLAYWASYQYAFPKRMEVASTLRQEIQVMEGNIQKAYQKRHVDARPQLKARVKSSR